ncbi:MAG TPA: amidohydrolase [Clostridiales bacterium]|nr:amidohydrolase [Clostridiales bacterium]
MALLIQDILYLPMTGSHELKRGSIRVEGQRIVAIGDHIVPTWGDEIISGHDKCALPGFVNCHCHAAMSMLRGYGEALPLGAWLAKVQPAEKALTAEDFFWGALLAQMEMLKAGITCYADMYFDEAAAYWAMDESGIRAVLADGLTDLCDKGEAALKATLQWIDSTKDDLEGKISFAIAPHAVYSCSGPYLKEVAAAARSRDLPLHLHIAETEKEQEDCLAATGQRVLPYLDGLGVLTGKVLAAHMIHLKEEEFEITRERDIRIAHCPQSNMKLASGIFPYPEYQKRGVVVGLATDGPASNNDLDMLEEMRTASLLQKVANGDPTLLKPYEALHMATAGGARALFLDDRIGTLEVGKKADITLLSLRRPHFYPRNEKNSLLSHLAFCAKSGDVHTVIVNGKVRVRDGQCVDIDEGRVYHEIQQRAAQFWQRQRE